MQLQPGSAWDLSFNILIVHFKFFKSLRTAVQANILRWFLASQSLTMNFIVIAEFFLNVTCFVFFSLLNEIVLLFQIRRRRPTPATLVASSDQSSPGKAFKCKHTHTHTYRLFLSLVKTLYCFRFIISRLTLNFIDGFVLLKLGCYICSFIILVTVHSRLITEIWGHGDIAKKSGQMTVEVLNKPPG